MKKRRKILWAAPALVLCAGEALHWLNQDTEGAPLSPETAEALARLGLDAWPTPTITALSASSYPKNRSRSRIRFSVT